MTKISKTKYITKTGVVKRNPAKKYLSKDFKISSDSDPRILYVFESKDGKISANFFYVYQNVELRGLVGIDKTLHIVYPFSYDAIRKPSSDVILESLIRRLDEMKIKK